MTTLPVREMVLYKHGVGFFVRAGHITGEEVTLTFRHDEINDVLKSLAVFDRAGGQVLGIHYQTPMDHADRLAHSSIRLDDFGSLRDLIRNLRGRQTTLTIEITPGSLETFTGRVIGLDMQFGEDAPPAQITLLLDNQQVHVFPLLALRGVQILDTQSAHDLGYFLDTSVGDDLRRTVNIRLNEGDHDLLVNYVAPSPTWRVSYRIVAETDDGSTTGKALLQGWGLFDNRLDEDLEDVRVTLVAGQPISFIYDLYSSQIPHRPIVRDQARIAPGPIEYEGAMTYKMGEVHDGAATTDWLAQAAHPRENFAMAAAAAPAPVPANYSAKMQISREEAAQAVSPAAEGKEAGEFFQYDVTTPVSVKRGESALVPIIGAELSYQRELLYNSRKLKTHPVAALRFTNHTGLTLERGPVTVVEDGDYKGEAIIAFTKSDNEVYIPYAVEMGIKVIETDKVSLQHSGLSIRDAFLWFETYEIYSITYKLENSTAKEQVVTIEMPIPSQEVFDTPPADVTTLTDYRWRVTVPAKGMAEFTYKDRQLRYHQDEIRKISYQLLKSYLEKRWLDQNTFDQLAAILDKVALIQRNQDERVTLTQDKQAIYKQQEQIRANMGALQPTGHEANLRNRVLAQLEETQSRLEAIDARFKALKQQETEAEQEIERLLGALSPSK